MRVNLHAGNGVGPLSAYPNCISIPAISFDLIGGVESNMITFFQKWTQILGNLSHIMNCKKKFSPKGYLIFLYVRAL